MKRKRNKPDVIGLTGLLYLSSVLVGCWGSSGLYNGGTTTAVLVVVWAGARLFVSHLM